MSIGQRSKKSYNLLVRPCLKSSLLPRGCNWLTSDAVCFTSMLASLQSDAHQLWRQSLQCSWTWSLKLSADGRQTAGLVIQPFQTVAEDVFLWSVGPKRNVKLLPI